MSLTPEQVAWIETSPLFDWDAYCKEVHALRRLHTDPVCSCAKYREVAERKRHEIATAHPESGFAQAADDMSRRERLQNRAAIRKPPREAPADDWRPSRDASKTPRTPRDAPPDEWQP